MSLYSALAGHGAPPLEGAFFWTSSRGCPCCGRPFSRLCLTDPAPFFVRCLHLLLHTRTTCVGLDRISGTAHLRPTALAPSCSTELLEVLVPEVNPPRHVLLVSHFWPPNLDLSVGRWQVQARHHVFDWVIVRDPLPRHSRDRPFSGSQPTLFPLLASF